MTKRRGSGRVALLAAAAVLVVSVPLALKPTTAAWSDSAYVSATAFAASWPLPALSCRIPADPAARCSATFGTGGTVLWPLLPYDRQIVVTTTSATPVAWEVTLSPSSPDWPITGASRLGDLDNRVDLVAAGTCSANPRWVTIRGSAGYQQVSSSAAVAFRIREPGWFGAGSDLLNC